MDRGDELILDALPDPVVMTDDQGACLFVNKAFCTCFGVARRHWIGRLIDLEDLSSCNGGEETPLEWRSNTTGNNIHLHTGRPINTQIVREAKRHSRRLAAMSHEMRTPLNGILGMTGLLMETDLNSNQSAYAMAVRQSGIAMLDLINNILDYSKIDAGRLSLDEEPFDLRTLVRDTVELLSPRAGESGLDIVSYISRDVPQTIIGDSARLRQLLLNLAGNSVKFTENGGVSIEVYSIDPDNDDTCRLRFDVIDTGVGIKEEDIASVFDEFSQVGDNTPRQSEGTGLGLAIVRQLVKAMNGEISIKSTPGKGSTFSLTLPFRYENAHGKETETPPAHQLPQNVVALTKSPILARNLRLQFGDFDVQGLRIINKAEDLPRALRTMPDATLLCDRTMAGDIDRSLLEQSKKALVLLPPTARSELPALREAGYSGYLITPIRKESLAERLTEEPRGALADSTASLHTRTTRMSDSDRKPKKGEDANLACRILLAEDNEINAILASTVLKRQGHTVRTVVNGKQAVEAMREEEFDVILMDMHMPMMDGLSATKYIRALDHAAADTPVVALTANAMRMDKQSCLDAGMDDFLTKPFEPGDLAKVVDRWRRGREHGRNAA